MSDPECPDLDGFNKESSISTVSPAGRTDVSAERYAELVAVARPDLILAIADIQSAHVSTKRHAKAVERTKA